MKKSTNKLLCGCIEITKTMSKLPQEWHGKFITVIHSNNSFTATTKKLCPFHEQQRREKERKKQEEEENMIRQQLTETEDEMICHICKAKLGFFHCWDAEGIRFICNNCKDKLKT